MRAMLRELPSRWLGLAVTTVFWCLLWGGFSPRDVLGGLAVAILVYVVFPLPSMAREVTLRPLAFLWLCVRFLWDMTVSAVQIAWWAVRPGPEPPTAVIAVPLASRSDLFLTFTAALSTLIPGSVVVEAQRATGTLFLHVIGVGTEEAAEVARERTRAQEMRLLQALARKDVLEEAEAS
ncbi:Na+/H+ antiporter subunit E [Brachybacterium endophyticum]|uniref:Na+/H+ antiporter subunit E n=1 Tax=Brachybacterium endophyticum TaxID=2182385 RepID=A0A2U2RL39_9MICO|nr:Na+/H+ antiporter subunit E [Brachybacterium endophyticum]PWH06592.1 Na+/H+ antiporter subunit E [Brachybacterium endophyticum]